MTALAARTPLGFGLRFIVLFALLMGGFEALRGTGVERALIDQGVLQPARAAIVVLAPSEPVTLDGRTLVSPTSRLRILRGCEGVETLFLLAAAVLAFPAPVRAKVRGLLAGGILAWGFSVLRVVGLYFALRYRPDLWEPAHGLIAPLLPMAGIAGYFVWWSRSPTHAAPSGRHAL
jgi:exosortase family protein XrtM